MSKIFISERESQPINLGHVPLSAEEMMFYLYLPVKTPVQDKVNRGYIPDRLGFLEPLLREIEYDLGDEIENRYVYITCKNTYVSPNSMSQRMGWHIDGFQTTDLNYIWYSKVPTEFSVGDFVLSRDDRNSLLEMERQTRANSTQVYPVKHLLKLRAQEVHRVCEDHDYEGMRLFVKISVSDHKFNLKGNSINYLLPQQWELIDRSAVRNMESNKDFTP